jgi:hypothetical protein
MWVPLKRQYQSTRNRIVQDSIYNCRHENLKSLKSMQFTHTHLHTVFPSDLFQYYFHLCLRLPSGLSPSGITHLSIMLRCLNMITVRLPYLPCGGRLEYLQRRPASRRRWRKGSPVPWGITGPPCHWEDINTETWSSTYGVWRLPESSENNVWSWAPWESEQRMTVLVKTSSNLTDWPDNPSGQEGECGYKEETKKRKDRMTKKEITHIKNGVTPTLGLLTYALWWD